MCDGEPIRIAKSVAGVLVLGWFRVGYHDAAARVGNREERCHRRKRGSGSTLFHDKARWRGHGPWSFPQP
jgi:hypothetical protein